jgi:hypothetical protein
MMVSPGRPTKQQEPIMTERLFSVVPTIAVLVGSTLAIGSEFFSNQPDVDRNIAAASLPRVVITGSVQHDAIVAQRETGTYVR